MKRICGLASGIALLAAGAAAQDDGQTRANLVQMKADLEKMVVASRIVGAGGGVMGRPVKGAPYSGQEVNESTQTLGDGTRIRNESRSMVYRDGEGRVRREMGDNVTIWDPVGNVNISLDTKAMTAIKFPMAPTELQLFTRKVAAEKALSGSIGAAAGAAGSVSVKDGMVTVMRDGKTETFPVGPDGMWVSDDGKMRGMVKQGEPGVPAVAATRLHTFEVREGNIAVNKDAQTMIAPAPPNFLYAPAQPARIAAIEGQVLPVARTMFIGSEGADTKSEPLGEQTIEGVKSRGTRMTSTIETGKIGNDRPLTTVSERWYSDDLQLEVMNRRSDPRSGEQIYRLVNINRSEPGSYLFQVPSGYTVTERK